MINQSFWKSKKVFITGHTGFKGSWLSLWLTSIGAEVYGYALESPTTPSLYKLCGLEKVVNSSIGDIRDSNNLSKVLNQIKPDIVIHMAAQPLVRDSYLNPVETYSINVMGTVFLFEAIKKCDSVRSVINVTTDKCYENKEWLWGYRENDSLGGYDPYSNSKACSELVTAAYRNSYFHPDKFEEHRVALATVRAGNVIGGGDWAKDRLVPDCIRALLNNEHVLIRNPHAIRPWQHVLEPLSGYLLLAEKLSEDGVKFSEAWNFGPNDEDVKTVHWIVQSLYQKWGSSSFSVIDLKEHLHEAKSLKLDCSKAKELLKWQPCWGIDQALDKIIEWSRAYAHNENLFDMSLKQIEEYSIGQ